MYIIGRVNVNATAFSFSPLSLSVIQRHDLWLVSDFQHHPSSPGFTTGLHVVNHAEGLSLIPLNPLGMCFRVALQEGKLCKTAVEGACLGNIWGLVEPLALITWPNTIIIKTRVKLRPMQDETHTGDLRSARIPEPALFHFEMSIMDVKCWVSLQNQSQAKSDCDLAKITECVQRPISSCYSRLCKLTALSSSSSFLPSLYHSPALTLLSHTREGGEWWQGGRGKARICRQKSRTFCRIRSPLLAGPWWRPNSVSQAFETWDPGRRQECRQGALNKRGCCPIGSLQLVMKSH